jgi:hypothetical protein
MLRKLVARQGDNKGKREFVRILQLHQDYSSQAVEEAVQETVTCGAFSYDAVKHVLRTKEEGSADVLPLAEDLIPGITDRRIEISDVRRYGAHGRGWHESGGGADLVRQFLRHLKLPAMLRLRRMCSQSRESGDS